MVQPETQAAARLAGLREGPWGNELDPSLANSSFLFHKQWGTRGLTWKSPQGGRAAD